MTPEEALAQIRALCNAMDPSNLDESPIWPSDVRAIIDAVSVDVTPAQSTNRDALLAILLEQWTAEPRETVDRILALVQNPIRRVLYDSLPAGREWTIWAEGVLARIFAEGDES